MTIWGHLERISTDPPNDRWVQVRTVVPESVAIRTYVLVEEKTFIARGTEQVSFSNLREGEFVEVTFRSAHIGLVKADAIYAQPESMTNKSKVSSSASSQTSPQSCMQQASSGPEISPPVLRSTVREHRFGHPRPCPFNVDEENAQVEPMVHKQKHSRLTMAWGAER